MFSENAATGVYFQNATLVARDRDLFKRYIPIIRELNIGGWEPITYAVASNSIIYVERFGRSQPFYFTVRGTSTIPL